MRAIRITEFGGPEVLVPAEVPDPVPGEGELLVEVTAAGVNYADTHTAENSYLTRTTLPLIPGGEVVGRTPDGRRVLGLLAGGGGYAERAVVHEALAFDVPESVSDEAALALLIQGTTAWHLLRTSSRMAEDESVVVVAAAGGVGSLAVQLARRWDAGRIVATASSEEKRALALELGADAAVDPDTPDLTAALREANGGRPVDVVLEMAGGAVFDGCLAALAPFGRLVTYGMAGREAPKPVAAGELMARSRAVVGFWLAHCALRPDEMLRGPLDELFGMVADGSLRVVSGGRYPLAEARRAHEDLRARRTAGKLVLDPSA